MPKIAVTNQGQPTEHYFYVSSDYDFTGNNAIEVTGEAYETWDKLLSSNNKSLVLTSAEENNLHNHIINGNEDAKHLNSLLGKIKKDYKWIRQQIKTRIYNKTGFDPLNPTTFNQTNWDKLDNDEKKIASRYFLVPSVFRDQVHTDEEQNANSVEFHNLSVKSRESRHVAAIGYIYRALDMIDANEVIDDVENNNKLRKYLKFGREGTVEGDPEALFDYLEARSGTTYSLTGLKAKAFTPINGKTITQVVDDVIDILKNGNY